MGSSQQLVKFYLKRDEHTYWTLPVDSGTTAKDIALSIASKLEINPSLCYLCEAKLDKGSVWEREIAPTEKILSVQSKWNPKKYAEKFIVVKPNKIVKKENHIISPPPVSTPAGTTQNNEESKYIEESWRERAHSEIELLRQEIQVLSETNASLQQQLYEEKQKRNSIKNPGDVVKQLMEAEQKIDDLQVLVKEMNDQSNQLEVENADLFQELNQAARAIGGPYEEKISAIKRTPKKTTIQPSNNNNNSSSPSISSSPVNPRTYFEGNRSESPNYLIRKDNMTSADYDRNIEVASLGLDLAELQKSQRARERALEESKQRLREELEQSKQRRSDVLKESKQVLLEELESIKSKSDISKKKFEDSLLASRKKLEHELETIEKKRKAQEDVRWSRPMNGFSSTLSPSKQDGFSISPSSSPTPTRRELFTSSPSPSSPSPSRFDDSINNNNNSNNNSPLSSSQLSYSSPKFSREGERKPFSLS